MKGNILFTIALFLFNVTIFTDFLPFNTVIRFFVVFLLLVDFALKKKNSISINPLLKYMLLLNVFVLLNYIFGGDLSYALTFTVNTFLIIMAMQSPCFAKTEIKIMSILLLTHLALAFFAELAPEATVNELFSKIMINGYNSNLSWRTVSGINVGLTNQPGVLSMYMVALSSYLFANFIKKKRLRYIIGYILSIAVILFTEKRSAIVFSILTILVLFVIFSSKELMTVKNKKRIKYIVLIAVGVLFYMFLNNKFDLLSGVLNKNTMLLDSNDLSNGRFSIWENAIGYFSNNPVFGIGIKKYYLLYGYDIHNTYLQALVEMGIIGFSVFIICIGNILLKSIISLKKKYSKGLSSMESSTIIGLYLLVFLALYGFVGNTFIDYLPLSLFLISICLVSSDIYSKEIEK